MLASVVSSVTERVKGLTPLYFPGTFSDFSLNTSVLIPGEISLPVLTLFLVPKAIAGSVIMTSAVIGLFDPFGLGAVSHALALTIATIVLWATGVVAEFKTSMLFYTLAMLRDPELAIAKPAVSQDYKACGYATSHES